MKSHTHIIYSIKIVAIVLLALGAAWLLIKDYYFTALFLVIAIVVLSVSIYLERKKLIRRMEQMISGIRHSEFSFQFVDKGTGDELYRLSQEMNEALEVFRTRTETAMLDETETEAWQKLISVLTHEIMNSITPIISLSETLSEQQLMESPSAEDYEIMHRALETIHRRSSGLLTFVENYRKLTHLPKPEAEYIPVMTFMQSLQQLFAANNNVGFSFSVYPEQLQLKADKNLLEQMMLNLLKNSSEACAEMQDAVIDVKIQQTGDAVGIHVSDNGPGISEDALSKIFIPFYSTKKHGSGIGLSLCRQIMILHKGKISVQSDSRGTRFSMEFPQ